MQNDSPTSCISLSAMVRSCIAATWSGFQHFAIMPLCFLGAQCVPKYKIGFREGGWKGWHLCQTMFFHTYPCLSFSRALRSNSLAATKWTRTVSESCPWYPCIFPLVCPH